MVNSVIGSKDVYHIIHRALEIMDVKIVRHGERTGYILLKMLQAEGDYTEQEILDYTMLGLLHDIGMIKTGYSGTLLEREQDNVWAHSIYGYLFLKYLSPIGEKAEIVLYHHLPYNKHHMITSRYLKIAEYLTLADKTDIFLQMKNHEFDLDYFQKNINVEISPAAVELFQRAQKQFRFLEKLSGGDYQEEMEELLGNAHFDAKYKKAFLEMLIYAVDFRSQQTVLHTLATTSFATELGRLMRVSSRDIQVLYYGALLHDIGKIAIPVEILEAPRKLSGKEMKVMKAHVVISEQILRGIISDEVLEVAVRHHEKLDGTGYPKGRKAEELTQLQRIVAVADILSALYGKRSYKEAFDKEKIKDILKKDAEEGKICEKTVAVAVGNFDRLIQYYETQRENTIGIYMTILEQYEKIYEKFKIYE